MKYVSTRGQAGYSTFEQALFSGYAPDNGLFVPVKIPQLSQEILNEWKQQKLSYPEIVVKIVRLFIPEDEIPTEDLQKCVGMAYVSKFTAKEIIPITELTVTTAAASNDVNIKLKVAELYHGRTKSFKDLAMSLVGQLMNYYLTKRNSHTIVLVGTSGDTGSAAMDAVCGSSNIDIIVLYPKDRISEVQELQLKCFVDKNIHLYEVDGTSDDLDVPIKKCFPCENLTSINSINWARIMIQISHYVYLYINDPDITTANGHQLHVIVPTGAAGNLSSGIYAYKMGLPINLHLATNQNDCVDKFLSKGVLEMGKVEVIQTPASAMDIGQPYNVERLLYLFSNPQVVAKLMKDAEHSNNKYGTKIPEEIMNGIRQVVKGSLSVSTNDIYETIRTCWNNKYMACPHTATGLFYFDQRILKHGKVKSPSTFYVLATASPHKFPESAETAGIPTKDWNGNELLDLLRACPLSNPKTMWKGDNWYKMLLEHINQIRASKLIN